MDGRAGWTSECGLGLGAPLSSCPPPTQHIPRKRPSSGCKAPRPRARHRAPALPWGLLDRHLLGLSCIFPGSWSFCFSPRPNMSFLKGAHLALCLQTMRTCQLHLHILFQSQERPGKGAHGPLTPPSNQLLLLPPGASCLEAWWSGGLLTSHRACLYRPPPDPDQDPLFWRAVATPASTLQPARGAPSLQGRCPRVQGQGCLESRPAHPPSSLLSPFSRAGAARMPRASDPCPGWWGQDCRRKGRMDELARSRRMVRRGKGSQNYLQN